MSPAGVTQQPVNGRVVSVESAGVGYHRLLLTRNIRVSEANMPTSTNMQSSTHLSLLVVVLVMVLKPLPHPGSPPTEDVMQRRGREKKEKKRSQSKT